MCGGGRETLTFDVLREILRDFLPTITGPEEEEEEEDDKKTTSSRAFISSFTFSLSRDHLKKYIYLMIP
jgi:hypothetical protein